MKSTIPHAAALMMVGGFIAGAAAAQDGNASSPLYRVTVVERSTPAINYMYGSGPTKIDFRGTVLHPPSKGDASVESKKGRTEIDAEFDRLVSPQRFGLEYLTYVLWAISPEGRPHNLGELVLDRSDGAKIHVTTDLQAFALIVTAEPYSAVRQPSDVVVLENVVRSDTKGTVQPVQAKYALLPRGTYTLQDPSRPIKPVGDEPKVSMKEYEALSEMYQAQNAIAIAVSHNADKYAPDTMQKARTLYEDARRMYQGKGDKRRVVDVARESAQTAEDARVIAQRRSQEEEVARARAEAAEAQRAKDQAEAEARSARAQAEAEREARTRP
jgi:hypothetical protein